MERLRHATGRSVIAAASAAAYEGYNGHGLLTRAIRDGFTQREGSGEGFLELLQLAAHIDREVPVISQKWLGVVQRPHHKIEGKLDADWVILSACNTAGGQHGGENAEALSGLARAFFYAGGRALLVSHWAVGSDASVKLTTGTFEALKADPAIGRAEAFLLSMRNLIRRGSTLDAHPMVWAPFVVVGEGAR